MKKLVSILCVLALVFASCEKEDGGNENSSILPKYAELDGVRYFRYPPMDLYGLDIERCEMKISEDYPEYAFNSISDEGGTYKPICKEISNSFFYSGEEWKMNKVRIEISASVLPAKDLAQILYNDGIRSDGRTADGNGLKYTVPGDKLILIVTQSGSVLNLDFCDKNNY